VKKYFRNRTLRRGSRRPTATVTPKFLWNSYNIQYPATSKSNARGGTSGRTPHLPCHDMDQSSASWPGSLFRRGVTEVLMWDVIMVAIGIGLFALSIGYAYACDRL